MSRKINIDRPDLSSKEIASRQDFSSLVKQLPKVTKPPFYKTGWFITTVASVAGVAIITTNFISNDKTSTPNQELNTSVSTETPPSDLSSVSITHEPHPEEAPIILTTNHEIGTEEKSLDQSAQIAAVTMEKTESEVNPDKKTIEEIESAFGSAKIAYEEAVNERISFEMTAPVAPVGESSPERQFVLEVSPKEFPELAIYKNLLFEVAADDPNFSPAVYEEEWEDIQLKTKEKGKTYYLSLFKGNKSRTFTVFPVYAGADFEIAKNKYEKELEIYTSELQLKLDHEKQLKAEYDQKKIEFDELKKHAEYNLSKTD